MNFQSRDKLKNCILNIFEYSEHYKKKSGSRTSKWKKVSKKLSLVFYRIDGNEENRRIKFECV